MNNNKTAEYWNNSADKWYENADYYIEQIIENPEIAFPPKVYAFIKKSCSSLKGPCKGRLF